MAGEFRVIPLEFGQEPFQGKLAIARFYLERSVLTFFVNIVILAFNLLEHGLYLSFDFIDLIVDVHEGVEVAEAETSLFGFEHTAFAVVAQGARKDLIFYLVPGVFFVVIK